MKTKGHVIRFEIKNPEEEQKLWDAHLEGEFSATMTGFDWFISCSPEEAQKIAEDLGLPFKILQYKSTKVTTFTEWKHVKN